MRNPLSKQARQAVGRGVGASPIYGAKGDLSSAEGDVQERSGAAVEGGVAGGCSRGAAI